MGARRQEAQGPRQEPRRPACRIVAAQRRRTGIEPARAGPLPSPVLKTGAATRPRTPPSRHSSHRDAAPTGADSYSDSNSGERPPLRPPTKWLRGQVAEPRRPAGRRHAAPPGYRERRGHRHRPATAVLAVAVGWFPPTMRRRGPPRGRWRRGARRRPGSAPHDVEAAQRRGLLELVGQVVQEARGRHDRLSGQPRDQPVDHHVGEPFDLGVDGWDRLVRQDSRRPAEVGHARINSSVTLDAGRCVTVERQVVRGPRRFEHRRLRHPKVY
jgi:hypothetical protein